MKVLMMVEVDLGDSLFDPKDNEQRIWAENEILVGDKHLVMHSNDVGDYIGEVTKVIDLIWLDKNYANRN